MKYLPHLPIFNTLGKEGGVIGFFILHKFCLAGVVFSIVNWFLLLTVSSYFFHFKNTSFRTSFRFLSSSSFGDLFQHYFSELYGDYPLKDSCGHSTVDQELCSEQIFQSLKLQDTLTSNLEINLNCMKMILRISNSQ